MRPDRHSACRGFTLVELLVVIAIIGLLAALLAPALRKAKESAKAVKCTNNLRQLALYTIHYAEDHDGKLPSSLGYDPELDPSIEHGYGFWAQLYPYYKDGFSGPMSCRLLLYCPVWPWQDSTGQPSPYAFQGFDVNHGNYGFITYAGCRATYRSDGSWFDVLAARFGPYEVTQVAIANIAYPSDTMMYTCAGGFTVAGAATYSIQLGQGNYPTSLAWGFQASEPFGFLHNGRQNFAFVDGHIESLSRDQASRRCHP